MRQGVGEAFTYNLIIIFIIIVFGLLSATLSYYKAFKVNSNILSSIEKYEGYNKSSEDDIARIMNILGYSRNNPKCASSRGRGETLVSSNPAFDYCVYYYNNDGGKDDKTKRNKDGEPIYYNYSVVSYIFIELPIIGNFKIPVYTKGERTYNFSDKNEVGA